MSAELDNKDRAGFAEHALNAFYEVCEGDEVIDFHQVSDLICDLMHLCDREGFPFEDALESARMNYEAEVDEEES